MDLPKNEAVFDLKYTGETTGREYEGRFTILCVLNMAQKHSLELEKTRLMGNFANPTDGLTGIAVILATLRSKIVDAPEWWKQSNGGYEIMDEDVLVEIYNKILTAEVEWRENLKKKGQKAQEKTSKDKKSE